ncbi:MAG: phospholipase D family protein [Flavobacterium sp.]
MKVIQNKWLSIFLGKLKNTKKLKLISPFISDNMVSHLLDNWKGDSIQVITRFNLNDFRSGVSNLNALKRLIEYGAEIKGIKGLHSKAYIFDTKSVIITSANFTNGGFFNNHELGIKSDDEEKVIESIAYFNSLWDFEKVSLNIAEINEWKKIIDNSKTPPSGTKLEDHGTSIVRKVIGDKKYFIKFYGNGDNREDWDEDAINQLAETHCHFAVTFPDGRRPIRYSDGDVVYMARMIEGGEYAIFGKAIARQHYRNRDVASEKDIKHIHWKKFYPIYIRVHSGEFLNTTFRNCPMMGVLMNELGYECFKKTKERHDRGEQNINPRLSLMRKPDIWLSEEGAYWVEQKFQEAIKLYHIVPQQYIDSLYQGTPKI